MRGDERVVQCCPEGEIGSCVAWPFFRSLLEWH